MDGTDNLVVLEHTRQRDHLDVGKLLLDLTDGRDTVQDGHDQVHQDDVRLERTGLVDRVAAVGRLADDLEVVVQSEEHAQPLTDDRVVVGEQDADHGGIQLPAEGSTRRKGIARPTLHRRSREPPARTLGGTPTPVRTNVTGTSGGIRVVIADDELWVRRGLAMRLGLERDLEVVGQASDATEAVAVATETRPDLVVLDVRMPPGGDGLGAIPRLRRAVPGLRVVVLSLHDDQAAEVRAMAAGADAFVSKSAGDAALLRALRGGTVPPSPTTGGAQHMIATDALATTPVLTGERVELRPLGPAHLEPFWASVNDPELRRLTGTTDTFTHDGVAAWLAARQDADDRLDLAIHLRSDETYIGELALLDVDPANAGADVRIALDNADRRGHGFGREALALLLDYVFDEVGLHRVGLDVYAFNTPAIRAYERLGFRHEGRLREVLHQDGAWHDSLLMGLLRKEWQS